MAYTPNTLVRREGGFIEGPFNQWDYTTADGLNLVLATGYFSDGSSKGMQVGDIVWVVTQGSPPTVARCQCSASTVTTTGGLTQHVGSSTVINTDWNLYSNPRNMLDGGDATTNPWQRGTSATLAVLSAGYITADRWFAFQFVSASSAQIVKTANTTVPGFSQAFAFGRAQSSGSVSAIFMGQVLESLDSIRAQGQVVTFSFYAQTNTGFTAGQTSSQIGVQVVQGFGTDQSANSCVAGTWTSQAAIVSSTQGITSTMTRYSFSATVSTTATQLAVLLNYTPNTTTATTAENVLFAGFQLEIGGLTPFEHREIEQELAYCQRYFFQAAEIGTSGSVVATGFNATNSCFFFLPLPVQMRAAPTVTVTNGSFGVQTAGAGYTAVTSMAAGATHTVNYVNVTALATVVSGQGNFLISSSASTGVIKVSADL